MDIKEIAERVSKRVYVEDGLLLSKFISEKFAEALIESYKAELLKEVVEPVYVVYNGLVMESTFIDKENAEQYARNKQKSHDLSGSLAAYRVEGRFTSDQVAAAIAKATGPLESEIEQLKEIKDVQLDIHSNNARTNQQRELDGSLEMGQLLADSKNEETGNSKAERTKPLAWMHAGNGCITDSDGKFIGAFSGDFRYRDRIICAVNSETELRQQLAAAQEEGATVTSERDNLWFKLETAKAELADLRDQLAKAEQRVAEWQPISTAPKDGSFILLATPKGRIADGFWSLVYGVWSWPYVMVEPTHWMPLPKAPNGASS